MILLTVQLEWNNGFFLMQIKNHLQRLSEIYGITLFAINEVHCLFKWAMTLDQITELEEALRPNQRRIKRKSTTLEGDREKIGHRSRVYTLGSTRTNTAIERRKVLKYASKFIQWRKAAATRAS